ALSARVEADLRGIIDQELENLKQVSELDRERDANLEFTRQRAAHFVGRQNALQTIEDYLAGGRPRPLVIHGVSGSGKSALMAKSLLDSKEAMKNAVVTCRFIGTTPA